jgi:4-diphosphocytidyl-2-C-methyl-D-erythritol kinase
VCPGVDGENLAARALAAYRRASGWAEPRRLTIDKRVPVAAGMGGGSSDAAATLRLAAHAAGNPADPRVAELAPTLGADVPALLHTAPTLVTGAGEEVTPLGGPALAGEASGNASPPAPTLAGQAPGEAAARTSPALAGPYVFAILPSPHRLGTADVYAEADRLGLARSADELAVRRAEVEAALASGGLPSELMHNDLEAAARSLCPTVDEALGAAREAGADLALVSGSGPTVVALFADPSAAATLVAGWPDGATAGPAPAPLGEVRAG